MIHIKVFFFFLKFFIYYIISTCLIIGLFILFLYIQNNSIEVNTITVDSDKIPNTFNDYKILHLSDIHNDYYGKKELKLTKKIIASKPDIIVITGDLIDSTRYEFDKIAPLMKKLSEIAPIYYVYGNHEKILTDFEGEHQFEKFLSEIGVKVLNIEAEKIFNGEDYINIIGIQDPVTTDGIRKLRFKYTTEEKIKTMLDDVTNKIDNDKFTILLSHRPEHLYTYSKYNIDLALTGHAHGGQVRIPFIGGIYAPHQGFLPKYTEGLHRIGNTNMIVSRGLGNSSVPVRIFNTPEIVEIVLKNS